MKNIFGPIQKRLFCGLMAAFVVGCGSMESDPPAQTSVQESDEERDDRDRQEVEYPFLPEEESFDEDMTPDDGDDLRLCARVCFKTLWCHDESEAQFSNCVDGCTDGGYGAMADEGLIQCVDDAPGCSEIAVCEQEIDACKAVCEVGQDCAVFTDDAACHQWCAGELWSGRLDEQAYQCVLQDRGPNACENLTVCGLSPGGD